MSLRRRVVLLLVATIPSVAFVSAPAAAQAPTAGYHVIVNADNRVDTIQARDLGRMFRKELTRWGNGSAVQPVDQRTQSSARAAFTREVHGRSVAAIAEYWRQQIFSARNVPPVERQNDAEVLEYVRSTPGAVGYVSPAAELTPQVKVVVVTGR